MSKLARSLVFVVCGTLAYSASVPAQQEVSDAADLAAVIALRGKPCGQVVQVQKRGDNDFIAACQDGNRYHVYLRDGRVVVDEAD